MRFFAVLTALALATFTTAAPVDTSPASPLLAPRGCTSPSCALVTFYDRTQVNWNNVQCVNAGKEVIGILVGECYCVLYSEQQCKGNYQEVYPCPGAMGPKDFNFPPKSLSCGGWAGGKP
ncbi:hypothetical protein PMIN06_007685 [Paraphaeosphaeria minitans]|uniref:Uncharacterized protein n=1 Tax=Paraphaeosphaeria minitans TaxID=565426 RepID=A0A9P6GAS3_9PLEO|nr:hypothetical protein PMIN01_10778 [Paraphaeosphaeria minitans]